MSGKAHKPGIRFRLACLVICAALSRTGWSMGLRSFVALPVEKGEQSAQASARAHPRRASRDGHREHGLGLERHANAALRRAVSPPPGGDARWGDVSALYRYVVRQVDGPRRTSRLAVLGGAVVATDGEHDTALQAGAVATFHRGRYSWDLDILYQAGRGSRPDGARYDISWQYRVTPAEYPDWGLASEWDVVLELNGRYVEERSTIHQATAGLQWVHRRWVLEGGITKDLSGPRDTTALLSIRWHY